MNYTELDLINARTEYVSKGIAEMNAVANVISNPDPEKADMLRQVAQTAGEEAGTAFNHFLEVAQAVNPAVKIVTAEEAPEASNENWATTSI